ncbi:hypothetical protein N656DRAFT_374417 [Canariomyces notabilis]|uniref:Uncharacterized protein n=1 Tax=Canariomyces notabilis TaxID=2074819 RepID=A0AAN6QHC0_9PEZI|nr:hypothetical protein N656DRAFT_374417 [Canariomyces arenarius]
MSFAPFFTLVIPCIISTRNPGSVPSPVDVQTGKNLTWKLGRRRTCHCPSLEGPPLFSAAFSIQTYPNYIGLQNLQAV